MFTKQREKWKREEVDKSEVEAHKTSEWKGKEKRLFPTSTYASVAQKEG